MNQQHKKYQQTFRARCDRVRAFLAPFFARSTRYGTPVLSIGVLNRFINEGLQSSALDLVDGWPGLYCSQVAFREAAEAAGWQVCEEPNLHARNPKAVS